MSWIVFVKRDNKLDFLFGIISTTTNNNKASAEVAALELLRMFAQWELARIKN
jgi:hypothetical protein